MQVIVESVLFPWILFIIIVLVFQDNKRYYKVKWVKVTWEAETDLAYFSNVIGQFWTDYQAENLLDTTATNKEVQFS